MHPIIEKLFKKNNIENISQLNEIEKIEYDRLIKELQSIAKPITPNDWEKFLQNQLQETIKIYDPDNSEKKKDFLWSQIYLIQKLLAFLQRPSQEEERIKIQYDV